MADSRPEKSRGMKFAEQQLLRHGWTEGKGLGRDEDGISEAIKVKVKCNKEGIGHKKGEEFTFHWWDHVFNEASSRLQVESDQNGVEVKTSADTEGNVSNKKPRKAALCKDKMYGCFVKAGTLLSGEEQPEVASCDPSSSSEDDERMDLSSTTRLSDADLMKACGGRTAHKGARHGFKMSAKLARLEQQEAEFMAKYGKKNQLSNNQQKNSPPADQLETRTQEEMSMVPEKKKKNKKKKKKADLDEKDSPPQEERSERVEEELGVMEVAVTTAECDSEEAKGKKKERNSGLEEKETEEECTPNPKKKKKKKRRKDQGEESNGDEEQRTVDQTQEEALVAAPPKKKKRSVEEVQTQEDAQAAVHPNNKKKEKKRSVEEVQTQEENQTAAHPKRKRRKESSE